MALNTLWVLTLIFSSISIALFAVRVAVIPSAVDSVSLFASPLALLVSRILSLKNLLEASSATLRAPLIGTGGWTRRSRGIMWVLIHLVRKVRWLLKRASLRE